MARNKSRNPAIVFTFLVLFFLGLSLGQKCIAGSQDDMVGAIHSPQGKQSRVRRQACVEYEHEGRTCCKCGAGYMMKEHCSMKKDDQKCEPCKDGTFNSEPNTLTTCEPCKPCSQPNANLEVDIPCSRTRDTVCKCKEHHYCISGTQPCTECRPCKECDPGVGVKISCSITSDTICNEPKTLQGAEITGIVLGITIPVLALIVLGVYFWRKRKTGRQILNPAPSSNGVVDDEVEMEPLNVVEDLTPYIPELASEIGWPDMRNIGMGVIKKGTMETIEHGNAPNSDEGTIQLLRTWAEAVGKDASRKLIQGLKTNGRKAKAEKVKQILSVRNS